MNYGKYKQARNASWQCLIDYNICSLPVKVSRIANQTDIVLLKNSAVNLLSENESGTTLMQMINFISYMQMSNPLSDVDLQLRMNSVIYF